MKKKFLTLILSLTAMLTCIFSLTACVNKRISFKLNFVVDNEIYATIDTSGDEAIVLPQNPTKEKYSFDGWFWDKDVWEKPFTANSLLDVPLSSDMSVYAKFSLIHVCAFTEQVANDTFKATNATCEERATYYYSCTCGEKGTGTFESGEPLGHSFTNYEFNDDAKCGIDGTETAICDHDCGESDTKIKSGSALEHDYSAWVTNNNGTKTGTCECGYSIIAVDEKVLVVENNVVKSMTEYGKTLSKIVIPNSVTSIGDYAFYSCNKLTSIEILDSVTSIGDRAFYDCTSLTSAVIPNSVTSIGDRAFEYCYSLTSVVIGDSVTSIGSSAFGDCHKLVEVINKSSHITVTKSTSNGYLGYYALAIYNSDSGITESQLNIDNGYIVYTEGSEKILVAYNGSQTNLTIPNYITKINDYAFYNCDSLTSIEIPNSVTSIGNWAFYGCSSLTSVEIPNSVTSIGFSAFFGCTSLTSVVIGDGVTSIGSYAYAYCDSLTSIEIPNSVTSIGSSAFRSCDSLTSATIGNSVTSIGDEAFAYCDSLTSVVIGNSVKSIGSSAFAYCSSLTSIVIPDRVKSIGSYAFYSCKSLTSIEIPNSVTSIGDEAFAYCDSLTSIMVDENNENYKSIDGNLYSKDGKTLIQYAIGKTDTAFTIPNGVTSIDDGVFYNCSSLTSIEIPNSVTSIGDCAFFGCSSLTSIEIPDTVTSIGERAFFGCSSLTSIKYRGSQAQWSAITKGTYWNYNTGNYTITYNYTGE